MGLARVYVQPKAMSSGDEIVLDDYHFTVQAYPAATAGPVIATDNTGR